MFQKIRLGFLFPRRYGIYPNFAEGFGFQPRFFLLSTKYPFLIFFYSSHMQVYPAIPAFFSRPSHFSNFQPLPAISSNFPPILAIASHCQPCSAIPAISSHYSIIPSSHQHIIPLFHHSILTLNCLITQPLLRGWTRAFKQ